MAKNIAHSEILVYKVHTIHKHMTPYYFKALSRQKHGSKMREVLNLNMMKERSHLRNAPNFEAMLGLNRNTVTEVSLCYRLGSPDPSECERWGGGELPGCPVPHMSGKTTMYIMFCMGPRIFHSYPKNPPCPLQ